MTDTTDTSMLHWPSRADNLLTLEEHLRTTANFSRLFWALTLALCESPDSSFDKLDFAALHELAGELADHSSAALCVLYRKSRG